MDNDDDVHPHLYFGKEKFKYFSLLNIELKYKIVNQSFSVLSFEGVVGFRLLVVGPRKVVRGVNTL